MTRTGLRVRIKDIQSFGFFLVTLGVFYLPRCIRLGLFGASIGAYNVVPFMGIMLIIFCNRNIKQSAYLILFVMYALVFFTEKKAGILRASTMIIVLVNLMAPMVLLFLENNRWGVKQIQVNMKWMNFAVLFTFAIGILDKLTNSLFAKAIARFSNDAFFNKLANGTRWFSWYGHYLSTGEIFLLFYILNIFYYRRILNKKEPLWQFGVAIIAALLVGSKTCTVILLIVFLLLNLKKMRYAVMGSIMVMALYSFGVFDLLLSRISGTDITSGRIEALAYLLESKQNIFPLLLGNGTNAIIELRSKYANASAGLEFVLLQFSVFFGMVFTLLFAWIGFAKPLIRVSRKQDFVLLIGVIGFILDVSVYNGLAVFQDQMYIFGWFIAMVYMITNNTQVNVTKTFGRRIHGENAFIHHSGI